ncbi:HEAT repeat domain-containing protein [Streptomyces lateritius]|uniref:HEAT repeat domain-containing protein n=1 Tax=Streptomyces lateritius TaxID=67313 RepID=UPI0037D9BF19
MKAIWALGAIPGPEAREALEGLRDDENEIIRENAVNQLTRRGELSAEPFLGDARRSFLRRSLRSIWSKRRVHHPRPPVPSSWLRNGASGPA